MTTTRVLRDFLILWLCTTLALPAGLIAATTPSSALPSPKDAAAAAMAPLEASMAAYSAQLQGLTPETARTLPVVDNFLLRQGIRRYAPNPSNPAQDIVAESWSLNDANLPKTPTFSALEVLVVYDEASQEIRFQLYRYDSGLKRRRLEWEQFVPKVKVTNVRGEAILMDQANPNWLLFATPEGIRHIMLSDIQEKLLRAPIPSPVSLIGNLFTGQGGEIVALAYSHPDSIPRPMVSYPHGVSADPFQAEGDLIVTSRVSDGTIINTHVTLAQLARGVAAGQLGLLLQLQLSPEYEATNILAEALGGDTGLREEAQRLERALDEVQRAGSDVQSSDLLLSVLRRVSFHTDHRARAGLFSREDGRDAFARLGSLEVTRREVFPTNVDAWTRIREQILSVRRSSPDRENLSWQKSMEIAFQEASGNALRAQGEVQAAQEGMKKSRLRSILATAKKYATHKSVKWLGAMVAVDSVNQVTGGEVNRLALSCISHLFGWTTSVPFIGQVTSEIAKSGEFLLHHPYPLSTVVLGGLAISLSFRPLMMWGVQRLSRLDTSDALVKFYTETVRMYRMTLRPVQALVWEKVLRQKNLYYALETGLPVSRTPEAWNNPFASEATINARYNQLVARQGQNETRNVRAMLIAMATYLEGQNPGKFDPATLMEAMAAVESGDPGAVAEMVRTMGTMKGERIWDDHIQSLTKALIALSDKGAGPLDAEDSARVQEYYELFKTSAAKLQAELNRAAGDRSRLDQLRDYTAAKLRAFRQMTSAAAMKKYGPLLLFGLQGYQLSNRLRGIVMPQHLARQADAQFGPDYIAGTIQSAAADPAGYGGVLAGGSVVDTGRVLADQVEQVFLYSVKLGGDTLLMFYTMPNGLVSSFVTSSDVRFPWAKAPSSGGIGREQTLAEAGGLLKETFLNPNARSISDVQIRSMEIGGMYGLQTNMILGLLPRVVAMIGIAVTTGTLAANGQGVGFTLAQAALLQLSFIWGRMSWGYRPDVGLMPGYGLIWAPVRWASNVLSEASSTNQERMAMATWVLQTGLQTGDRLKVAEGIQAILGFYVESGQEIPERFLVKEGLYPLELGQELLDYHAKNPSLATLMNTVVVEGANYVGSIVSTMFALEASKALYRGTDAAMALSDTLLRVGQAFGGYAATLAGVKALNPVFRGMVGSYNSCVKALSAKGSKPEGQ